MTRTAELPKIAVTTRSFGNDKSHEGIRVRAGTRYAIEEPQGGLPVMKAARYRALFAKELIRPWDENADAAAAPRAPQKPASGQKAPPPRPVTNEALRARTAGAPGRRPTNRPGAQQPGQNPNPPAPERLAGSTSPATPPAGRSGSQTLPDAPASSSPAAHPSEKSPPRSTRRGERRG